MASNNPQDAVSDIIRQLLVDLGACCDAAYDASGQYTGQPWPAFAAGEPAKPDNAVTVYDTQGQLDGRTMDGEENVHYGVQLRVRAVDSPTGWTKASALRDLIASGVRQQYVTIPASGNKYTVWALTGIGPVLALGKETPSSTRFLFTINALASVRPWQYN